MKPELGASTHWEPALSAHRLPAFSVEIDSGPGGLSGFSCEFQRQPQLFLCNPLVPCGYLSRSSGSSMKEDKSLLLLLVNGVTPLAQGMEPSTFSADDGAGFMPHG